MPVTIRKVKGGYEVRTLDMVHSKHTTFAKAQHQANLLRAVEHGWHPTGKPARGTMRKSTRINPTRPRIGR